MNPGSNGCCLARIRAGSVIAGLLLAISSCGASEGGGASNGPSGPWSRVSVAGEFSLELPPELTLDPKRGTDALYRSYRSDALVVSMDYGWYSNPLVDVAGDDLERQAIQVDGHTATHVRYRDRAADSGLEYVVALHVPDTGKGQVKLTIVAHASSEHHRNRADRILRSLRFGSLTQPAS